MSEKYKVRNPLGIYFITFTVVGWVDLFIRIPYKECIVASLRFCQQNKGLNVFSWVIMSSHIHLIVSSSNIALEDIVRDFKTFTSKELLSLIKEISESRREWMLKKFSYEANRTVRGANYKLWQDGFHPIELTSNEMQQQRLDYIHNNAVEAGIVEEPEHYLYSSARNYAGMKGLLDIEILQ